MGDRRFREELKKIRRDESNLYKEYNLRRISVNYDLINSELEEIYSFIRLNYTDRCKIINFYRNNPVYGSVIKNMKLVKSILEFKGYNEEEIFSYFYKNLGIFLVDYRVFLTRIAVFDNFQMLDEVLYSYSILTSKNCNIKDIYAMLSSGNFESVTDLSQKVIELTSSKRESLRRDYPLNNQMIHDFYVNMIKKLKREYVIRKLKNDVSN